MDERSGASGVADRMSVFDVLPVGINYWGCLYDYS